jgi:hypothetical protein
MVKAKAGGSMVMCQRLSFLHQFKCFLFIALGTVGTEIRRGGKSAATQDFGCPKSSMLHVGQSLGHPGQAEPPLRPTNRNSSAYSALAGAGET